MTKLYVVRGTVVSSTGVPETVYIHSVDSDVSDWELCTESSRAIIFPLKKNAEKAAGALTKHLKHKVCFMAETLGGDEDE